VITDQVTTLHVGAIHAAASPLEAS